MSDEFWEKSKETYLENWPDSLHRLSIASWCVRLQIDTALLRSAYYNAAEGKEFSVEEQATIKAVKDQMTPGFSHFPSGCFVRLGSRSPKDSFLGYDRGFKVKNAQDAMNLLLSSERVSDDLSLAAAHKYVPYIWLREWLEIPPYSEFRCFCKGKRLIGVSQYNYLKRAAYPEIIKRADSILEAIALWFKEDFLPATHLSDCVVDVLVLSKSFPVDGIKTTTTEIKLVEINPFFNWTDPCLFNWNKPNEFDGSFRYNR